jgi:anti-anti-sigma factor
MATASAFSWQTWNSGPFSVERGPGKQPGTVILRFRGPLTLRDVYSCLPTATWNKMLELEPGPGEQPPAKNILDMTDCTYMDSSGLGLIVTHHVHCQKRGVKLILAAISPRVREVMKITRVDKVLSVAATVEEAEEMGL